MRCREAILHTAEGRKPGNSGCPPKPTIHSALKPRPPPPQPRPSLYQHLRVQQEGQRQPPPRGAATRLLGRPRSGKPGRQRTRAREERAWMKCGRRSLHTLHASSRGRYTELVTKTVASVRVRLRSSRFPQLRPPKEPASA